MLDEISEFAELEDAFDFPLRTYSDGMAVRLAFSVAMSIDPEVLILDEVLAVGDIGFQKKCFERISMFRRAGKTILFVSHSMEQVVENCDRAILLERGSIIADGDPRDVSALYSGSIAHELAPAQ